MATYFVNAATGNDANDGSAGSPWATVNKGLAGATGGSNHTVYVAAGNYYSEGIATTFNAAGGTVTLIATGTVNMRQSATPVYSGWVWWCTATDASAYVFQGHFNFDMSTINGKYWIQGNGSAAKFTFEGCEFDGGGQNVKVIASSGQKNIKLLRCYLHDIANYPVLHKGGYFWMESCFVKDVTGSTWFFADTDSVVIRNNTWINTKVSQYLSVQYGHLHVTNNIFVNDTATDTPINLTGDVGSYCISNNIGYKTNPSSPRQATQTAIVTLPNEPDYYDNSLYVDPEFTTAPALSDTSLAHGRGINNGTRKAFTLTGGGKGYFAGPPVIGCWSPPVLHDTKTITPIAKKVAIVGDSITDGVGITLADVYGNRIEEALTDYVFVKMPGDEETHLGISGIVSVNSWKVATEFVQSSLPDIVTVFIGVNDLGGGNRDPDYTTRVIIEYLDSIADLGAKPIYVGTPPVSANPANTDILDSLAVEDAVHAHCVIKGYGSARLCRDFYTTAGYDTLYYNPADYLHPKAAGHERIAALVQPLIEAAATTVSSGTDYTAQLNQIEGNTDVLVSRVTEAVATLWANLTAMITGSGGTAAWTTQAVSNVSSGGDEDSAVLQEKLDTLTVLIQQSVNTIARAQTVLSREPRTSPSLLSPPSAPTEKALLPPGTGVLITDPGSPHYQERGTIAGTSRGQEYLVRLSGGRVVGVTASGVARL